MISILIVDDHSLIQTGIQKVLESAADLKVVKAVSSGIEAIKWCRKNSVDVVLMDMTLPQMTGLEATQRILKQSPEVQVLMLTMHSCIALVVKALKAGVAGFLSKGACAQELIQAVKIVANGGHYLPAAIAQELAFLGAKANSTASPLDILSVREFEVLLKIANGDKASTIAAELNITTKTVNTYRYRLFQKLGVTSDVQLAQFVLRHGLLPKLEL